MFAGRHPFPRSQERAHALLENKPLQSGSHEFSRVAIVTLREDMQWEEESGRIQEGDRGTIDEYQFC